MARKPAYVSGLCSAGFCGLCAGVFRNGGLVDNPATLCACACHTAA